jgi:hypothetical protein
MRYFQINKGMYCLPQAGLLARNRLVTHIAEHGYTQSDLVPFLFRHATNGISFVLVVDDFGIKYKSVSGRNHLLATLRLKYKITVDMQDPTYLGMTLVHDKPNQTNNAIVYKKSKMHVILQVDASYLSRSNARSVADGVAYFGDADNPTKENGMIYAISSIIDVVVSSAGEAEYGAAFIFAQQGVGLRNIATALGHMQPPTPILCDINLPSGWPQTLSNRKNPRVSTCASIGFAIESDRASSPSRT